VTQAANASSQLEGLLMGSARRGSNPLLCIILFLFSQSMFPVIIGTWNFLVVF